MTEILNIEYHTRDLLLRALNVCLTKEEAAIRLGISEKTLYTYCRQYRIKWDRDANAYICKKQLLVVINEPE